MDHERHQHLESLRYDHLRRLHVLERQAAQFGARADAQILNEIEDIQAKIAEIDQQLGTPASAISSVPSISAPSQSPLQGEAASHVQRCTDLAESIQETLNLIKSYEEQRRLSDDPKVKRRAERSVVDLRSQLDDYEKEQRALECKKG